MMPKSYLVFKWTVYSLATLLLFALQYLVLDHIQVWGLTPFLYPMLPAVAASFEGLRRGSTFALAVGVVCDLLLPGPFEGFYAIAFTLTALIAALMPRICFPPAFSAAWRYLPCPCSLPGACAWSSSSPEADTWALCSGWPHRIPDYSAGMVVVVPLYRLIHDRCASDY